MFQLTASQRHWLEFLLVMTEKEIKARYKFAALGFLWIVLNPLLQMFVIGFIFQYFIQVQVQNYFLFLISGLLVWNFFSYTVSKNTPMIVNERSLIQKAKFPRESIVLSIVLSNLFHVCIAYIMLVIYILIFHEGYILQFLQILFGITITTILTAGVSLLSSSLNVRYRDTNFFIQAVMPLWFYATPVVYTRSILPSSVQKLLLLNPMTGIVELFQYIFLQHNNIMLDSLLFSSAFSISLCVIGWKVFQKNAKNFDDWI